MTYSKKNKSDREDVFFNLTLSDKELNNKRKTVRYIRKDISTTLFINSFFSFSKYHPAELLNISSQGASIKLKRALSLKQKVILIFVFEDKRKFKIAAKIVFKDKRKSLYGIKFDHMNNKFGDYLISSQKDFVFE